MQLTFLQATFSGHGPGSGRAWLPTGMGPGGRKPGPGIGGSHQVDCEGDSLSASIAAASILAKVYRDDIMLEMAERYPQYGFEVHKGYGTKRHYAALEEFGPLSHSPAELLKSFMPGSNLTGPWGRRWRRRICGKKAVYPGGLQLPLPLW